MTKASETIQELRAEGYRVQVRMGRLPRGAPFASGAKIRTAQDVERYAVPRPILRGSSVYATGGVVSVCVWAPGVDHRAEPPDIEVKAVCSVKDHFVKRVGLEICAGRLLKAMAVA